MAAVIESDEPIHSVHIDGLVSEEMPRRKLVHFCNTFTA